MGALGRLLRSPASRDGRLVPTLLLLAVVVGCIVMLLCWCRASNSMVLLAYATLCYFHLLSLLTCLLSVWVASRRPDLYMTFGYERCETLAVFSITVLVQLAAMLVAINSAERLLYPPEVVTGRLLRGAGAGLTCQVLSVCLAGNRTLQHAMEVTPSTWLQEQCADIYHGLLGLVPGVGRLPPARVPSLLLLAGVGAALVAATVAAVDARHYRLADPLAALVLVACIWVTMMPLCVNVGKSLLQTAPAHVVPQLDKSLREALTLDGVLEFRHEHFWTLSTGVLAGSLHVRVRRDANEQDVLAKVSARFASLIHVLTVQVFKDDWTRSQATTIQLLNSTTLAMGQPELSGRPPTTPLGAAWDRASASRPSAVPTQVGYDTTAPARYSNGSASSAGHQRICLRALDDTASAAPPSGALSYYVSVDGDAPRLVDSGAAGVVPHGTRYR